MSIIPPKLQRGDEIRVIAPARSLALITLQNQQLATEALEALGFNVTFGEHVSERDDFVSSSIASRISDLHTAFADPEVTGILTVIGGFNSNQLLGSIDWELIKSHPKIICGYSDITALANAIYAKTGVVTYSGPHYSSFAQQRYLDFTIDSFRTCLMDDEPHALKPSEAWTDDAWYEDQDTRELIPNPGYQVLSKGDAAGTIVGGNLCTFNLLQGTEFIPQLEGSIFFLEDDDVSTVQAIDRDLQSLIHQPGFAGVKGLVIGRFQKETKMTPEFLRQIIASKPELQKIPVIAGLDFGHTDPKITFPIGGTAKVHAGADGATIEILKH